jgi:hypothetical protein
MHPTGRLDGTQTACRLPAQSPSVARCVHVCVPQKSCCCLQAVCAAAHFALSQDLEVQRVPNVLQADDVAVAQATQPLNNHSKHAGLRQQHNTASVAHTPISKQT